MKLDCIHPYKEGQGEFWTKVHREGVVYPRVMCLLWSLGGKFCRSLLGLECFSVVQVLDPYQFPVWAFPFWKWGVEISNYYCWIVYFSLQSVALLFYFKDYKCPSLSLVVIFIWNIYHVCCYYGHCRLLLVVCIVLFFFHLLKFQHLSLINWSPIGSR